MGSSQKSTTLLFHFYIYISDQNHLPHERKISKEKERLLGDRKFALGIPCYFLKNVKLILKPCIHHLQLCKNITKNHVVQFPEKGNIR